MIKLLLLWLVCAVLDVISLVWLLLAILSRSSRAWKILLAHDQLGNAVFGGDEDEYISSRCYRYRKQYNYAVLYKLVNWLFNDKEHCKKAYEDEVSKKSKPVGE